MSVIDAHVHIYPDKIAARAVDGIRGFYGGLAPAVPDGSVGTLLEVASANEDSIDRFVVLGVATKAKQVRSVNDFLIRACEENPQFIGMMSMHQEFEDPQAEIQRGLDAGLTGMKIHPDMQGCPLDDPGLMNAFEAAQAAGIPVVIHMGDPRTDLSHPARLVSVLRAFPQLKVCAAHFGGWTLFDVAADLLAGFENCYVDTSSSIMLTGARHARELVDAYGVQRVMFGSDFPVCNPLAELERLRTVSMTPREFDDVTCENAKRFLGLRS